MGNSHPDVPKNGLMRIHYNLKHKDKFIACIVTTCNDTFTRHQDMQIHYKQKHLQERFQCSFCSKSFAGKDMFKFHMDYKHPEKSDKPLIFKCTESNCEAAFSLQGHLREHKRKRHKEDKKWECPICHGYYRNVASHIKVVHKARDPVICHLCDKPLKNAATLRKHVNYVHMGKEFPTMPCIICGIEMKRAALKRHIEAVHEGVRLNCAHCDKTYSSAGDLAAHARAVHQGIKAACRFCPAKFQRGADRNQHEKQSHAEDAEKAAGKIRKVIQIQ